MLFQANQCKSRIAKTGWHLRSLTGATLLNKPLVSDGEGQVTNLEVDGGGGDDDEGGDDDDVGDDDDAGDDDGGGDDDDAGDDDDGGDDGGGGDDDDAGWREKSARGS